MIASTALEIAASCSNLLQIWEGLALIHAHAMIVEAGMCWLGCCKNPAVDILVLDPASLGNMRKLRGPPRLCPEVSQRFCASLLSPGTANDFRESTSRTTIRRAFEKS
jgi:hypothetical protein